MVSGVLGEGREGESVALCFWDIRSGLDVCQPPAVAIWRTSVEEHEAGVLRNKS
jgi:hypothetical protein